MRCGRASISSTTTTRLPTRARRVARTRFSSLANFLAGTYNPSGFTQTFGHSVISQTNPNLGLYVQDEWKANQSLTFNAGLRYDLQFLETINTDTNNVSPRVGFAWVAVRLASNGRAGQCRSLLRSRAVASGSECAALGRQHDRLEPVAANQYQPVTGTAERADLPEHPVRTGSAGDPCEPDDDGSEHAECVFAAGERRNRATGREAAQR